MSFLLGIGLATGHQQPALQNATPAFNVAGLAQWSAAVRDMQAGNANARLLCIGHSVTEGEGSSGSGRTGNPKHSAWPTQLAGLLRASGLPASSNNVMGAGLGTAPYSDFDARVSYGANWSLTTSSVVSLGGTMFRSQGSTEWQFTPDNAVDSFHFYYARNSGLGTFEVVTEGVVRATIATALSAAVGKTAVSFPQTTAPIVIRQPSTTDGYIIGGHAFLSSIKEISIYNAGWGGSRASHWSAATPGYSALNGIGTVDPDLTIINLDINDANGSVALATFTSQYGAIIDKALTYGDVLCLLSPPTNPGVTYAAQQSYADAITALAGIKGILAPIDMRAAFGGVFVAAKMYDQYHPNTAGAADIAAAVKARITP